MARAAGLPPAAAAEPGLLTSTTLAVTPAAAVSASSGEALTTASSAGAAPSLAELKAASCVAGTACGGAAGFVLRAAPLKGSCGGGGTLSTAMAAGTAASRISLGLATRYESISGALLPG